MWDAVREYWVPFNEPLEGVLPFMYLDTRYLVTTGMGNLIDAGRADVAVPTEEERIASHDLAARISWLEEYQALADYDAVAAAWDAVKVRTDLARHGGGAFSDITELRIDDDEVNRIVGEKLDRNEQFLIGREPFSAFADWPADAQLGLLSMAWALGPAFNFPKFQAAVAQRNWTAAAQECAFGPHVGTIEIRNGLDWQCFNNAAVVEQDGLDPSVLLIAQG